MWNICKNLVYLEYPTGPGERLTPLALGSIRGYFGDDYGIFTDITDDVLTGTFEGLLGSSSGSIRVREGEFKIKIFWKYMPCGK